MDLAGEAAATAAATAANPYLNGNAPPPFLSKTYDMVDDPATDAIVSWGPESNSFVVWDTAELSRQLLPKFFKHGNFSSFVRQLNTYGFRKVDPDRWEFANEGFLRGQKHLLKTIARRKPNHLHTQPHQPPQQPQTQNAPVGPCVELGKFGVVEEIDQLKRDKNALMQELVRLRQQQQATDLELQTLGQRLQGMEQRQQQMVSFLAKAMQSPGFLAQLVHQTEAANKKKRRLPAHDNLPEVPPPNGQIIKYQPLINEAAKAMLMQILDASPRLESPRNSSPSSGVTLAEVQFPEISQIPGIHNPRGDYTVAAEAESPYIAPTTTTTTGLIDVEEFLNDTDDPSLDEGSQDLPGIDDPFWETLLSSPASGEANEVESNMMEATKENGWHGAQNMESLTTQMGLLTREAGGQRLMQ